MQLVAPSGAILFAREQDIAVERPGRGMIIIQHLDLVLYEARPYKLIAGFDGNIETIDTVDVSFGQSNQNVNDTTA